MVTLLLNQENIDINSKTGMDSTPLHLSAVSGAPDACRQLLSFTIKRKCENGNFDAIHPIKVNAIDDLQMTPLHYAAQNGYTEIVNDLINYDGIDVNCVDRCGNTPLHLAAKNNHKDIIMALLSHKDIKPALLNEDITIYYYLLHLNSYYSNDTPSDIIVNMGFVSLLQYFPLNEELNDDQK